MTLEFRALNCLNHWKTPDIIRFFGSWKFKIEIKTSNYLIQLFLASQIGVLRILEFLWEKTPDSILIGFFWKFEFFSRSCDLEVTNLDNFHQFYAQIKYEVLILPSSAHLRFELRESDQFVDDFYQF